MLMSQARVGGMGGFVGFDYGALPVIFASRSVPPEEWDFILDRLTILTTVAVSRWNKKPD